MGSSGPVARMKAGGVRLIEWPDGQRRHALGLGTYRLGESAERRAHELAALRQAFEIGWRAIDTAEMYADGGAEAVVGEALAGAFRAGLEREDFFVVSKVYPHHASFDAMLAACDGSRRRLGLDTLDLYLLHWRGSVPLAETVRGFCELQRRGWIRQWGVSNFDRSDLSELVALDGGGACAANQVWHSLSQRGVEFELLPWMQKRRMPLMAYSPIDLGALARAASPALQQLAERHRATPAQVALAALLAQPGVMPIPMSSSVAHLRENWAAQAIELTPADQALIDQAFSPPRDKQPLAMN